MLGYISSTRKKSCRGCVKAKRRCDLGFPICHRCMSKGLDCSYPSAAQGTKVAEVVVRQRTPDLVPFDAANGQVDCTMDGSTGTFDPSLFSSDNFSSPESLEKIEREVTRRSMDITYAQRHFNTAEVAQSVICSAGQVRFMINAFGGFLRSLAYLGSTPFIHECLYRDWQPPAFQDCCSLAALYLMKTTKNTAIITSSIRAKVSDLVMQSSTWSLVEHLAAVQALIIYQIIRMFDRDINMQGEAEKQIALLEIWTANLWKRAFNDQPVFSSSHQSWIFYESLRRTVMISTFLRGAWGCLKRNGLCTVCHLLGQLPVTRDTNLWALEEADWNTKSLFLDMEPKESMVRFYEYSSSWKIGDSTEGLSEYERFLLVSCRGEGVLATSLVVDALL